MPFVFGSASSGKVAQHDDDLVLHVERARSCRRRSPGCRERRCRSRRTTSGPPTSPLSEKESARTGPLRCRRCRRRRRCPRRSSCRMRRLIVDPPSLVPAVNSNGSRKSCLSGQRLRADLLQLGDEVVARRASRRWIPARRPSSRGDASVSTCARVFDVCARDDQRRNRGDRKDRREKISLRALRSLRFLLCRDHDFFAGFLGGAFFSASIAFSWFHCARNSWPRGSAGAARRPGERLAVRRGHRQAVEARRVGDLHRFLRSRRVDHEQLEVLEPELVRREDELLAGRVHVAAPSSWSRTCVICF